METFIKQNPTLVLLVLVWITAWTGVALWRAARLGHIRWFIAMLVLQTLGLLEIIYIFFFAKKKVPRGAPLKILRGRQDKKQDALHPLVEFSREQGEEKERRKEQIMDTLRERGDITNDEVEELLGVGDTTAYRYLQELEEEGKIKQVGETGRSVHYKLKE